MLGDWAENFIIYARQDEFFEGQWFPVLSCYAEGRVRDSKVC